MRGLGLATLALGAIVAPVGANEYQAQWGPPVGAALPAIAALDQDGDARQLADLAGERGTLLFMVRSADW